MLSRMQNQRAIFWERPPEDGQKLMKAQSSFRKRPRIAVAICGFVMKRRKIKFSLFDLWSYGRLRDAPEDDELRPDSSLSRSILQSIRLSLPKFSWFIQILGRPGRIVYFQNKKRQKISDFFPLFQLSNLRFILNQKMVRPCGQPPRMCNYNVQDAKHLKRRLTDRLETQLGRLVFGEPNTLLQLESYKRLLKSTGYRLCGAFRPPPRQTVFTRDLSEFRAFFLWFEKTFKCIHFFIFMWVSKAFPSLIRFGWFEKKNPVF